MIAATLAAVVVLLLSTRWGLATSSDSARYVRTARNVYGSAQVQDDGEPKHEQAHFPPFYPIVLATGAKLTWSDPVGSAHWLHVLIFAGNVLLTGIIVRRSGGATAVNAGAALLAAFLVALAPASIYIHAWLLSEPLFIFLSLVTILLLGLHLERPRWRLLIGAAICASLGVMTRYAGAAIAPAAVLALLLIPGHRAGRRRVLDAAIFSAIFLLLPAINMARNVGVGGSATNRTLAFHPLTAEHVKDAIAVIASWASAIGVDSPRDVANAHPFFAFVGVMLAAAVVIRGANIAWRQRETSLGRLCAITLLYLVSFAALLAFSISFVDFHTPADQRVLSPMYFAWLILTACVATSLASSMTTRSLRTVAEVACVVIAMALMLPSIPLGLRLYHFGDGFAHAQWRRSPTIAAVNELPPELEIFTNAPGAVYLLTGRQVILTIPSEISSSSRLPNPDYPQLMERIRAELRAGRGVVVYLKRYGQKRAFYPTEQELKKRLGLHPLVRRADGAIYDFVAPSTVAATTSAATAPDGADSP